jgi:hypothetical protein
MAFLTNLSKTNSKLVITLISTAVFLILFNRFSFDFHNIEKIAAIIGGISAVIGIYFGWWHIDFSVQQKKLSEIEKLEKTLLNLVNDLAARNIQQDEKLADLFLKFTELKEKIHAHEKLVGHNEVHSWLLEIHRRIGVADARMEVANDLATLALRLNAIEKKQQSSG